MVSLNIPRYECKILVIGEDVITSNSFLEYLKKYYYSVKFGIGYSETHYKFDFFREKTQDGFYKVSLKFYTTKDLTTTTGKNINFKDWPLLIYGIDPRGRVKEQLEEIAKLKQMQTDYIAYMKSLNDSKSDYGSEDNKENDDFITDSEKYECQVLIIVNHGDGEDRKIGADRLLTLVQSYDFSLIELSSISGVNLEFLVNYILNHCISQERHKTMSTMNVLKQYRQEVDDIIVRLEETYGQLMITSDSHRF